jgi:RNA polymerase sigma factor (sigma-70 family)
MTDEPTSHPNPDDKEPTPPPAKKEEPKPRPAGEVPPQPSPANNPPPPPDDELTLLFQAFVNGDRSARDRLFEHFLDRFRQLVRRMLAAYPRLRAHHQTDDVLQEAMIRLLRSLELIRPESPLHFFRLGALQIRWHLADLIRKLSGRGRGDDDPGGLAAMPEPDGPADPNGSNDGAASLVAWSEFHEAVSKLPDDLQVVVDLLWYQGLFQGKAGRLLGVDVRTVKRRWRAARIELARHFPGLDGEGPGHD